MRVVPLFAASSSLLVVAVVVTGLAGCEPECSSYGECPPDQFCSPTGTCVDAVPLPDAGPRKSVGYVPAGGARLDGGVPPGGSSTGGPSFGWGAGTPGGGGGVMPSYGPPQCGAECVSAYDCTSTPDHKVFGVNNYRCQQGGCRYVGCRSDQDCLDEYGPYWPKCDLNAWPAAQCLFACNTAADCAWTGDGLEIYDEDNWTCSAGACRYQGCTSDYECEQFYGLEDLRCARMPYQDVPICWYGCTQDSDCFSGEVCYNGACGWIGCDETSCRASEVCVAP